MLTRFVLFALLILYHAAAPAPNAAQASADSSEVTLERLFSSDYFQEEGSSTLRWTPGGDGWFTIERSGTGSGQDLVRTDAASLARSVVVSADRLKPAGDSTPISIQNYRFSDDGRKILIFTNSVRVWRANTKGDYWVLDLDTGKLTRLGGPAAKPSTLMFAKFSPQGDRVAYVREHNIYVERLRDGKLTSLTRDGSVTLINGTFDWVYEEEFGNRDGFRWSPDGRRIAYWQLDASGVRDFLLINDTDSLYSYTIPVQYPKAGTTNSAVRIGVVSADGGKTRWMELPGQARDVYLARMDWAASSSEIVVQHFNRKQNTLTLFLCAVTSGASRPVLVERDSTWVDVVDNFRWLTGGQRFTWVSERDGWRHLYSVARDGRDVKLVTPGEFDVEQIVEIDTTGGWLYFIASPDNATQRYLYRGRLDGGGSRERLSPSDQPGIHNYSVAPGGRWASHSYSRFGVPPVSEIVSLPEHRVIRVLADNTELRRRLGLLRKGSAEFFKVDIGDVALDGYVMRPAGFDPNRRYPVLFFVYGEPAGQTALDTWGSNEYLWHLMLTQRGYAVISLDNRGTPAPRGRAWRKIAYRQLGLITSADQAAAARVISRWNWVDPERIGVWGWSGGGSTTLNLMFRYPEIYRTGMAVAPVPNMRFYDTIYQERYMGLPQENADDYWRGSPISAAEGLRGKLLLVHGTGDDNVHYQGTEALMNRLIELNKPFTMMAYPNRSHGIFEGEGTTRHVFELLTRFLTENLPANR